MNKLLRLSFAGLLLLAGCSKSGSDPSPTPTPDPAPLTATWTFQSETRLVTPKNGTAVSTETRPIPAGSYSSTFNKDGTFLSKHIDGTTATGTYTYSNNTITIPYTGGANGPKTQVLTVRELTATRLVTTEASEDTPNRYVTTDTFTR
jgi:hypothetical protein